MESTVARIKESQMTWARANNITVDDDGYTGTVANNLFSPLCAASEEDFRSGRGDELGRPGQRPKMCALHSSAALATNVFEYWRNKDLGAVASACGIGGPVDSLRFEVPHANKLGRIPSYLDVEFAANTPVDVESKFTETYSRRTRRQLASSYLNSPGLWQGLPSCEALAHRIKAEEQGKTSFEYLDAPQLLKHILGLRTSFPKGFRLIYLWYEVDSAEALQHRRELAEFQDHVTSDVDMVAMTHQELFSKMKLIPDAGADYLRYLSTRYFSR
jgi:hypothetical protein